VKVLGIDPGIVTTGFGVVESDGSNLKPISYGIICTSKAAGHPERLKKIYDALVDIMARERPDVVVTEEIFGGKNFKAAVRIGEVRSLAILAAANHNIDVAEYSPARIKEAIVGYGRAAKVQVQKMVTRLLGLEEVPKQDAADALATAICHFHTTKVSGWG